MARNSESERGILLRRVLHVIPAGLALLLIMYALSRPGVLDQLESIAPAAILTAVIIQAGMILALSWRWRLFITSSKGKLPWRRTACFGFMATALNLTLPSAFVGDVARVLLGRRNGICTGQGTRAALLDRVAGLTGLALLVLLGLPFLPFHTPQPAIIAGAAGIVLLAALGFLLSERAGRQPGRFLRMTGSYRAHLATAIGISVGCHFTACLVAWILARGLWIDVSLATLIALFPAVLLAGMLPLTVGGWGARELAAIPVLGLAGIPPEEAISLALAFGLTQLAAAALGTGLLWSHAPAQTRSAT